MIKALLSHCGQETSLLRFLLPTWQKEIELLGPPQKLDFPSMLSVTKWMQRVHYSWFYPHLSVLPQKTQELFFPLFSQTQKKGLATMLKIEPQHQEFSPFISFFLSDYLKQRLQKEDVIPLAALPKSALNPLIKVKWAALMQIIDYLGLYDLACDYKQVVDRTLIKKIFSALPKDKEKFVLFAAKQPTKWVSPKMALQNWDGDAEKLQALLHKRGLIRLTKGIVGEHLSFRWHFVHRLDVGRAKVMINALSEPIDHSLVPYFKNQILHIAKMVTS